MPPAARCSIRQALGEAQSSLAPLGNGRLEAEMLLASVLATEREGFYRDPDRLLEPARLADFQALVRHRSQGFPLAYLTGEKEFWSLPFRVTRATLIPRPETECLVEAALEQLPEESSVSVLELGSGSGAIAVALAVERPAWRITATDISREALAIARENAALAGVDRIRWLESDWFSALGRERFDLIVCNPPYVETDYPGFQNGELRFEPRLALDGGQAGLEALQRIIPAAVAHLHTGGSLLLEHGERQAEAVRRLLRHNHYRRPRTHTDLAGRDRLTLALSP